MRKIATACGFLEAFGLVIFTISLLVGSKHEVGTRGSTLHPFILSFLYLIFAVGISLVSYGISRGRQWPRTPYVLIQIFAILVFAYLPASGSGSGSRITGVVVGAVAVVGLITHWRTKALTD